MIPPTLRKSQQIYWQNVMLYYIPPGQSGQEVIPLGSLYQIANFLKKSHWTTTYQYNKKSNSMFIIRPLNFVMCPFLVKTHLHSQIIFQRSFKKQGAASAKSHNLGPYLTCSPRCKGNPKCPPETSLIHEVPRVGHLKRPSLAKEIGGSQSHWNSIAFF